tara:strand:- start:4860 stop:5105 length:246 start_codon:yes stop_codon:yes gene_type:complete
MEIFRIKTDNKIIMSEKKKHADFQDEYRKSSNFGKIQQSEDLKIKGDGELKVAKDAEMKTKSEERKISETLKKINSEEEEE